MSNIQMVCGIHAVKSAIESAPDEAITLCVDRKRHDGRVRKIVELAKKYHIRIEQLGREQLDERAEGQVHQGLILLTRAARVHTEKDLADLLEKAGSPPLVLVLDGVTDPHNLGACLRTADAAGVDFVIAPKDRAVGLTSTARKAASGAAERLPFVQVTNLSRTLKQLQDDGLWITGTAMQGDELYSADLTGPRVIVMGSEGKGMRRLTQEHCDQLVRIPMQGHVESLNVSVATGVVLYEVVRQRRSGGTA